MVRQLERVELNASTYYSYNKGFMSPEALVQAAAAAGHKAVAITDYEVIQGFPEAQAAGKKYGIKIIYGMKVFVKTKHKNFFVTLLVRNQQGLYNLYKIISASHNKSSLSPIIPRETLEELREGLLLGSDWVDGEMGCSPNRNAIGDHIKNKYDFVEIQPTYQWSDGEAYSREKVIQDNKDIMRASLRWKIPVVAVGSVRYIDPSYSLYKTLLKTNQRWPKVSPGQPGQHFRTTEEMLAAFDYLPIEDVERMVVTNTVAIDDQIEEVELLPDPAPYLQVYNNRLQAMVMAKTKSLYGTATSEAIAARLDKELAGISQQEQAGHMLLAGELAGLADNKLAGNYSQAGTLLTTYLLGINKINPLPPHWHCAGCQYTEWASDAGVRSGFDLAPKACPVCGSELAGEGHDIPLDERVLAKLTTRDFTIDCIPDSTKALLRRLQRTEPNRVAVHPVAVHISIQQQKMHNVAGQYFSKAQVLVPDLFWEQMSQQQAGIRQADYIDHETVMVFPPDQDINRITPLEDVVKPSKLLCAHLPARFLQSYVQIGHVSEDNVLRDLAMLESLSKIPIHSIPYRDEAAFSLFRVQDGKTSAHSSWSECVSLAIRRLTAREVRCFSDIVDAFGGYEQEVPLGEKAYCVMQAMRVYWFAYYQAHAPQAFEQLAQAAQK